MMTILRRSDKVIANSQYTRSRLVELGIREEQIVIIPPGLNIGKLKGAVGHEVNVRSKYGLQDNKVMITVSRLVERKGHDITLRAVRQVVKRIPDLKYVICGEGPYRSELERLVQQYELEDVVVFTGGSLTMSFVNYTNVPICLSCPVVILRKRVTLRGLALCFWRLTITGCRSLAAIAEGFRTLSGTLLPVIWLIL